MKIALLKPVYVSVIAFSAASIAAAPDWSAVAIATVLVTAADWIGVTISNLTHRRYADARSLSECRCPDCGSPILELTSENDIACASCHMVYHPLTDRTVKRMGREKTYEGQNG